MKKILVLSPHQDDAVLSCTDHILFWKKRGFSVTVCTIFTKISSSALSLDARKYILQSGVRTTRAFEFARSLEDQKALSFLGVTSINLKYTDALFRIHKGKIMYQNFRSIFSGKLHESDNKALSMLKSYITSVEKQYSFIVVPFGIGNHIDHIITKLSVMDMVQQDKILHYIEAPYYFKLKNWRTNTIGRNLFRPFSLIMTTRRKREALGYYNTQQSFFYEGFKMFFFDKHRQFYPEIVIGKANIKI